jgi:hypothetical protein
MSSKSRTNKSRINMPRAKGRQVVRSGRSIALLVGFGALLGGCSDIYFDRRETVALGADDHIASNMVAQMADPWPRYVGNKNIAFNGERMQAAVERYRKHEVIRPISPVTSLASQPPPPITTEAIALPANAASVAAAPVK